jgi:predicted TIM-barrel fold metal-dependent hydrolase
LMIGSLSPDVQEKIAYKNAAKLFKINLNQPLIVGSK